MFEAFFSDKILFYFLLGFYLQIVISAVIVGSIKVSKLHDLLIHFKYVKQLFCNHHFRQMRFNLTELE